MRNYIILNGKNSNEINGLLIQELPPISKPLIRTEVEEIDGRDGDIVTPLGYSAYDKEFTIGLYKDFDVNEVAAYFNSEGTVIFSNEPDKYYYYQITAQIDFERLVRYRTATVTMHCQPFKYSATEQPITEDVGGTVSDEGTNLALENTAEAPFNTLDLKGNTSQQTYSGKNLLKLTPQASTSNGITATLTDGIIKYSGTASTNWANIAARTYNSIPAGDYMLSMQETFTTNYAYALSVTYTDNTTATFECWKGVGNKRTVTLAKDVASYYVYLTGLTSGTSYSGTISLMLESGSTATTPFEPYTNGPAPNPDYPQAVQTVTGENVVKICGKNLNEWENVAWSSSTTTSSWCFQNGATGAYGANITSLTKYKITLPAGTYTAKVYDLSSNIINIQVCADGTPNEIVVTSPSNINSSNLSSTITLAEATTVVVRYRTTNPSLGIGNTKVQIEKGSATAYEPYQGQSYEVNLGKNLFDKDNANISHFYPSTTAMAQNTSAVAIVLPVEAGQTYTASTTNRAILDSTPALAYTDKIITQVPEAYLSRTGWGSGNSVSATAPAGAKYMYLYVKWSQDATTIANVLATIQIEKGSTATTYAAYFTPIELCKIGTYQDSIYKSDGKWYVHKAIGKLTLTGDNSEGWSSTGTNVFATTNGAITGSKYPPLALCRYATFNPVQSGVTGALANGEFAVQYNSGNDSRVFFKNTAISNVSDFVTWVSENTPTIYYALVTPTDTEITNEALIEQLDNIYYHAHAYKGRTHITSSAATGNVPHIIAAEVGEDNESTITNAGNYLSKPKITVYGSGDISLYINDMHVLQITLGDEGYITIDTAQMEAYKDTLDNLKNRLVIGDYSNARLKPGANKIHFTGTVTKYVVENYSRWL